MPSTNEHRNATAAALLYINATLDELHSLHVRLCAANTIARLLDEDQAAQLRDLAREIARDLNAAALPTDLLPKLPDELHETPSA